MVSLITNYMHTCIIIMYPHANYTRIPILQLFSLGTIIRCIVMLIFILLAKFKYKCPNYDPLSDGNLEQAAITESDYYMQQVNNQ